METANSVIKDALQEILVQANEQPVQSVDFTTAVRYLNRMMAAWAANGLPLGYTKVANAADPITVPDGAIEGIVFNLALRLSTQYDIQFAPELKSNAAEGLKTIRRIAVTRKATPLPCTLPIGSGNEQDSWYRYTHFYPCHEDEVLTEGEGSILLESNTND